MTAVASRRSEPVRILIVVIALNATGGDRWLYELTRAWRARGAVVTVFHITGSTAQARLVPPAGVTVVSGSSSQRSLRSTLMEVAIRLVREASRNDVMVTETMGWGLVLGWCAARLTRCAIVPYSQGLADESMVIYEPRRSLRAVARWCLRRADEVFGVTPASLDAAARIGVPRSRLREVRTGVDVEAVLARRSASAVVPAQPYLIGVGTLERRKGYDRAINAIGLLAASGQRVHLVLVGPDGGERSALERQVESQRLEGLVTFTGPLDDPTPFIDAAMALVHPARSEVVGLVLLEALILHTPVIAHDGAAGGPRMVLDGGRYGRLVDAGDPQALADAISDHLAQPADLVQRAAAADAHVSESFSVDEAAEAALVSFRSLSRGTH